MLREFFQAGRWLSSACTGNEVNSVLTPLSRSQACGPLSAAGRFYSPGPAGSASPNPGSGQEQQQWSPRQASKPDSQPSFSYRALIQFLLPPSPFLAVDSIEYPGGSKDYNWPTFNGNIFWTIKTIRMFLKILKSPGSTAKA